jgi:hypothetical protein
MVNIPRALFSGRTGREPRYHVAIEELQDWTYTGNRLVPLKGYPGIVWERPKSRRRPRDVDDFEFLDLRVLFLRAHKPMLAVSRTVQSTGVPIPRAPCQ